MEEERFCSLQHLLQYILNPKQGLAQLLLDVGLNSWASHQFYRLTPPFFLPSHVGFQFQNHQTSNQTVYNSLGYQKQGIVLFSKCWLAFDVSNHNFLCSPLNSLPRSTSSLACEFWIFQLRNFPSSVAISFLTIWKQGEEASHLVLNWSFPDNYSDYNPPEVARWIAYELESLQSIKFSIHLHLSSNSETELSRCREVELWWTVLDWE